MARYRKLDLRTWNDQKFRELSPLPPSGQSLWLYLILGPQTSNIPGLFEASEVSMADRLGWSLEAFRKAFGEAFAKGMAKADWTARLVWLPKGPEYNRPESPNVVISWASTFDELPECDLKWQAFQSLKAFAEGLSEAYGEAFRKAFAKAIPNQEQEQEQEQDKRGAPGSPASGGGADPASDQVRKVMAAALAGKTPIIAHESLPQTEWAEWIERRLKKKWPVDSKTLNKQLKLLSAYDTETQRQIIDTSYQAGWQGLFPPKVKRHANGTDPADAAQRRDRETRELEQLKAKRADLGIPDFRDPFKHETPLVYETHMRQAVNDRRSTRKSPTAAVSTLAASKTVKP